MLSVHKIALGVFLLLLLFVVIQPAAADIYRYVDANGRVHFTDTPTHGRYNMYLKEKVSGDTSNRSYLDIIHHPHPPPAHGTTDPVPHTSCKESRRQPK